MKGDGAIEETVMGAGTVKDFEVRGGTIEVTLMGPRAEEGFVVKEWPINLTITMGRRELFVKRGTK